MRMLPANPSRVPFLLGSCLFALCAAGAIPGVSAANKPNVVFVLADDLGWGELGCYGQQKIPTPNIDRLAAQGMRFTQHYSGAPVCAPSRCVLMTGKHLGHAEVRGNLRAKTGFDVGSIARALGGGGHAAAAGFTYDGSTRTLLPRLLGMLPGGE